MRNKYPKYILEYLRQREGLDKNDSSRDNLLNSLPPDEAFSEVCGWNGLLGGYDYTIKNWIKDIYKIDIDKTIETE